LNRIRLCKKSDAANDETSWLQGNWKTKYIAAATKIKRSQR
jgi:hypothetical protein